MATSLLVFAFACKDEDPGSAPAAAAPSSDGGAMVDAGSLGAAPDGSADGGGSTPRSDAGSTEADASTGPGGGPIEAFVFPMNVIPTALITPSGGSVAYESGIESGRYRGALDEDGNLIRDRISMQYTFWVRSTVLPGDGSGSRIYWTGKGAPRNLICMGRNTSGSQLAYILDKFGGASDESPEPYPGQEAACSWELVKSTTDPERYAIKSLLFPLDEYNRFAYVGTMYASGTGAKYNIMPAAAKEPLSGGANVAWFKLNSLVPPVED